MSVSIKFETADAEINARSPSMALIHWTRQHTPRPETPDIEPGEVGFTVKTFRLGTNLEFMRLVGSMCERTWNQVPPLPHNEDIDLEEVSLNILKWLREFGDIIRLNIDGKEYLPM